MTDKPAWGMENWWIQEEDDGSFILRGNITGRSHFENGMPIVNDEATYTSTIIHYWENDIIETRNSLYHLGVPIADEILEANEQELESLRVMLGGAGFRNG